MPVLGERGDRIKKGGGEEEEEERKKIKTEKEGKKMGDTKRKRERLGGGRKGESWGWEE